MLLIQGWPSDCFLKKIFCRTSPLLPSWISYRGNCNGNSAKAPENHQSEADQDTGSGNKPEQAPICRNENFIFWNFITYPFILRNVKNRRSDHPPRLSPLKNHMDNEKNRNWIFHQRKVHREEELKMYQRSFGHIYWREWAGWLYLTLINIFWLRLYGFGIFYIIFRKIWYFQGAFKFGAIFWMSSL